MEKEIKIIVGIWFAVIMSLIVIAIFTANPFAIVVGLFLFIIGSTALIMDRNDYDRVPKTDKIISFTLMFIAIIGFCGIASLSLQYEFNHTEESTYYNIYHVDAPFGILWRDMSGRFVFGCGSINTDLVETYTVKYMIDNKLYTMQFDAQNNPLTVDGTFVLEKITTTEHVTHFMWNGWEHFDGERYVIHIPMLPDVNGTTTSYTLVP